MTADSRVRAASEVLTADPAAPAEALRARALDRFFAAYYRLHPVNASFIGMHEYDHQLPDWSPEGLSATRRELSELRRGLAAAGLGIIDDRAVAARDWLAIDGALADAALEVELAELNTVHFQRGNLSLALGEALFGLIVLMTRRFPGAEQRTAAVAARLRAFPLFLVGVRRTLEKGTIPQAWRDRVLRECEGGLILLGQVEDWLDAEGARETIRSDAHVGLTVARESLVWFDSFVRSLRDAPANRSMVGQPFLELLLRRGHWCDVSAESLRYDARQALDQESARLRSALQSAGIRDVGHLHEQVAARTVAADRFLDTLDDTWRAARAVALEHDLVTWPDAPLRFVPIPRCTRDAAPCLYYLFYRSPAPLDDPDTVEYVVPDIGADADPVSREARLRAWNQTAIKLNHVIHHGGLGHHVQNARARRAPSLIGRVAAVDCASRIALLSGGTMAEGWACYATDLMDEIGFLTPLERLAQQATRVRLVTRAVVDLELHGGRLGLDDAAAMYAAAGLTPAAAREECVKNSMFPGTSCMYWLGTTGIHGLREACRGSLGSAFSLRAFHDELLSFGSIPVALAARLMAPRASSPP
jgi:hypothetical protein